MMRINVRAVIFNENNIALIYREKQGKTYYTLPGGGVEDDELLSHAVIREVKEELGLDIIPVRLLYADVSAWGLTYYFLCNIVGGKFGTGEGEEYNPNNIGGFYDPQYVNISQLSQIPLKSDDLKKQLLEDLNIFGTKLDNKFKEII